MTFEYLSNISYLYDAHLINNICLCRKIALKNTVLLIFLFSCFSDCESHMIQKICNRTQIDLCNITVTPESAEEMKSDLFNSQSLLVKTCLNFPDGFEVRSTKETILPKHWIMTYTDNKNSNLFISWPVDYFLFSCGLLDSRTLRNVTLDLRISPLTCNVTIGDDITNCGIVNALLKITDHHKKLKTTWCYISEYPGIRNQTWYTLKVYFGLPIRMFGYRCCYGDKDGIYCGDDYNATWNEFQVVPYYVGIVFFCFFPILLMKCSARSMDSGSKLTDQIKEYKNLDDNQDEWLFLRNRSPISVSGILLGLFSLGMKHPVATSRIRRVIFILCLPAAIYAEICMYYFGWRELMPALLKINIPFGFASIAGGINESRSVFLPMFGGPFIALMLYFVIGIVVVVPPRDVGDALEKGLTLNSQRSWTLLQLNIITIEELSCISCVNRTGYHKVHAVLKASICMIINPQFWRFLVKFLIKRWKMIISQVHTYVPSTKWLRWPLYVLLFVIFVVFSLIETVLALAYYGVPVLKLLNSVINWYTVNLRIEFIERHLILKIIFRVIYLAFLFYFLFITSIIISESFNFLSLVVFYLYLSVIIFPNYAFSVVYSIVMLMFFIYRICVDIEKDYFEIYRQTIKAIKHHLKVSTELQETLTESVDSVYKEMHTIGDTFVYGEVYREKNNLPGIRKDLFDYVIRKHRPVHITIFLAIIQIFVMTFLVLSSIVFVLQYVSPMKTDDKTEIVHVMSILLITILPNLVYSFFTPKVNNQIRKLKIRQTVANFFLIEM